MQHLPIEFYQWPKDLGTINSNKFIADLQNFPKCSVSIYQSLPLVQWQPRRETSLTSTQIWLGVLPHPSSVKRFFLECPDVPSILRDPLSLSHGSTVAIVLFWGYSTYSKNIQHRSTVQCELLVASAPFFMWNQHSFIQNCMKKVSLCEVMPQVEALRIFLLRWRKVLKTGAWLHSMDSELFECKGSLIIGVSL